MDKKVDGLIKDDRIAIAKLKALKGAVVVLVVKYILKGFQNADSREWLLSKSSCYSEFAHHIVPS